MSKFTIKKFDGDGAYDWAVFRKSDLPHGHRGVVFYGEASPIVSGCSKQEAEHYKRSMK